MIFQEKAKSEDDVKSAKDIISQVEQAGKELDGLKLDKSLGSNLLASLTDPQGTRFK